MKNGLPSDSQLSGYGNIFLIGYRAAGKTTLAREISLCSGLVFLDTDHEIQQEAGMSIEEMVSCYGWDYFRDMEEKIMARLDRSLKMIVSTGGGIILRKSNRDVLKSRNCLCVYLKAGAQLIQRRLSTSPHAAQRPPLSRLSLQEEIASVLSRREPLYQECADVVLDASQSPPRLAAKIMKIYTQGF